MPLKDHKQLLLLWTLHKKNEGLHIELSTVIFNNHNIQRMNDNDKSYLCSAGIQFSRLKKRNKNMTASK